MTAAHCVQPGADYKLVGSEPGQPPVLKTIIRIESHPQFDSLGVIAGSAIVRSQAQERFTARHAPGWLRLF